MTKREFLTLQAKQTYVRSQVCCNRTLHNAINAYAQQVRKIPSFSIPYFCFPCFARTHLLCTFASTDHRISLKMYEENNDLKTNCSSPVRFFVFIAYSLFPQQKKSHHGKMKTNQRAARRTILPIEFRPLPHLIFTIELTSHTEYIIIKVARARAGTYISV